MYRLSLLGNLSICLIICAFMLEMAVPVYAQVRSSPSYSLESDSINVGGGFSSSTSFQQESTVGEVATGVGTSTSFSLQAGYQQLQASFLSLAGTDSVMLTPSLPGLTGGQSNGSTSAIVTTDNSAGYQLSIAAAIDPALQDGTGNSIADYTPAGFADFIFTIASGAAEFGYSVGGDDVVSGFQHNGTTCGIGMMITAANCWTGLTTVPTVVAQGSANQPIGATTTIRFRVEIDSEASVPAGVYIATTTVTALPL